MSQDCAVVSKQPCHLARLPNELVGEVLAHVVANQNPAQRRKTLRGLSLCGKQLGGAAQRLLWRHVRLESNSRDLSLDPLRKAILSMAEMAWVPGVVKVLELNSYLSTETLHLDVLAMTLPGVEGLALRNAGVVIFTHAAYFHQLRRLELEHLMPTLSTRRTPLVFPKLVTLSLRGVKMGANPSFASLFTSTTFPALRHLSLRDCVDPGNMDVPHFPRLASDFIGQLDELELDLEDQHALGAEHFPSTSRFTYGERPILFRCDTLFAAKRSPSLKSVLPVHYLQVDDPQWFRAPKGYRRLVPLTSLRLVLLPIVRTSTPVPLEAFNNRNLVARVAAKCRKRGVELRLYDPARPRGEGLVVPELRQFLRERAGKGQGP